MVTRSHKTCPVIGVISGGDVRKPRRANPRTSARLENDQGRGRSRERTHGPMMDSAVVSADRLQRDRHGIERAGTHAWRNAADACPRSRPSITACSIMHAFTVQVSARRGRNALTTSYDSRQNRDRSTPAIRRIAVRAQQQRHVIMLCRITHCEFDCHARVEGLDADGREIGPGLER